MLADWAATSSQTAHPHNKKPSMNGTTNRVSFPGVLGTRKVHRSISNAANRLRVARQTMTLEANRA
jgi:hypothetical protein